MTRNDTDKVDKVPKTLATMIAFYVLLAALGAVLIWVLF